MSQITSFLGAGGAPDPRQVSAVNPLPVTPIATVPSVTNKATWVRGLKAPADIAVPERIAAVGTYVTTVTIWALRAARVPNVASVFIDNTAANDTQLIEMSPGSYITFTAPAGKVIDLGDIYVDAQTLTDGVFFLGML